jgi:hypothetical protein
MKCAEQAALAPLPSHHYKNMLALRQRQCDGMQAGVTGGRKAGMNGGG